MTDAALPPIHDVALDADGVAQLFFDVAHAATLVGITVKRAGALRADAPASPTLADAQRALAAGELAAVQLRYRFGGEEWWDTVTRTAAGYRLVRISHTRALASASAALPGGEP